MFKEPRSRDEFESNMAEMGFARHVLASSRTYVLVRRGDSYGLNVEDTRGVGMRPKVVTGISHDPFDSTRYRVAGAPDSTRFSDPVEAFLWWVEQQP